MQVLVVEDDVRLAQAIGHILEEKRHSVDIVHDGADGLTWASSGIYDVIVLDVMLPRMDGFEVVRELRRKKVATPVLMLTARDATRDKVTGLDAGADDYLTKPFEVAEFLARLRSLTRRQGEVQFEELSFGDLELDLESCDLSSKGQSIHLSYKEFSLMRLLMAAAPQAVPKDTLITKVWGYDSSAEGNNVEAYVSFLRKKLRFLGSTVKIATLRQIGYRLEEPEVAAGEAAEGAAAAGEAAAVGEASAVAVTDSPVASSSNSDASPKAEA